MALKSVSTRELRRELARREKGASRLAGLRDKLMSRLDKLHAELSEFGMEVAGGAKASPGKRGRPGRKPGPKPGKQAKSRKRAKNAMSLPEAIIKSVKVGATVTPVSAAVAAKKAGYKSTSKHFGMMVANALAKDARFKRLERGKYQRTK